MKHIVIAGSTSNLTRYVLEEIKGLYHVTLIGRKDADIIWDLTGNTYNVEFPDDINVLICIASAMQATDDDGIYNLMQANVQGILNLCILARKKGVRHIIYVSSVYALLTSEDYYYNFYSMSKKHAEECLELYCQINKLPLCILRPSQMYGDDKVIIENQRLLYTMIENARNNKDIKIYGKNDALKNFIYIKDVARVVAKTIENEIEGKYNIICYKNYKLSQIANAVNRVWGGKGNVLFLTDKENITDNPFYDDSDTFHLLNLPRPLGIYEGLEEVRKAELEQVKK